MNIKEAEIRSGVSKRNIRFYEQKGLLHPQRNEDNDYRDYSHADVETLKLIRALRMIDMPLEKIREIVKGNRDLAEAASEHKAELKKRLEKLETAVMFCDALMKDTQPNLDELLASMDAPENRRNLSVRGDRDYATEIIKGALCVATGLLPCCGGLIFGLVALGCWHDLPILSYLTSLTAMFLWGTVGSWVWRQGGRLLDALLIHLIPFAACICYVCSVPATDLFQLGCYYPVMAALLPFSPFASNGVWAMVAPLAILVGSFLLGYLIEMVAGKQKRQVSMGWVLFATLVVMPAAAIMCSIFLSPLPTIATADFLQRQLSNGTELWVEEGERSYAVTATEEFSELLRVEEWDRIYLWLGNGDSVLEIHLNADRTEPYAIEFYENGTVCVYESWITTQEAYFHVPDEVKDAVLEYAEENGTLQ